MAQARIVPPDDALSLKQIQGYPLLLVSCYPPGGNSRRVIVTAFLKTP